MAMCSHEKPLIVSHRDPQGSEIIRQMEMALGNAALSSEAGTRVLSRGRTMQQQVEWLLRELGAKHEINCAADPRVPQGSEARMWLFKHMQRPSFCWDHTKVGLYTPTQLKGNAYPYLVELDKLPLVNACVLDYLLQHQLLIPAVWQKHGKVFFWGTQYQNELKSRMVRGMRWQKSEWQECTYRFDYGIDSGVPVVIFR